MLKHVLLAALVGVAGCYSEDEVAYPAAVAVGPSLTYAAPGVEVVTDLEYPVFFSDGFYWRWYGGYWYRSPYWDRGWIYAPTIPVHIGAIGRPWMYSHYRPLPGRPFRSAPRPGGFHGGPRGGGHRG